MNLNRERAIKFLQKMIQVSTVNPPGDEYYLAEIISDHAENNHLRSEIKAITRNRANIMIELEGNNPDLPPLIFSGHLDTVPIGEKENWGFHPFSGEVENGRILGRGSCDMKSGVAALIESMITMKESGRLPEANIIFVGTSGEEVDCIGAKKVIEEGSINHAGAMIIAEPSKNKVYSAHKGALWLQVEIYGRAAHGSMPSEGVNAIDYMMHFLEKIKQLNLPHKVNHPLLGSPTINIGSIEGGVQTNVVPDKCKVTIDIRTTPNITHGAILNEMKDILSTLESELSNFESNISILHDLPPLSNKENDAFVQLALQMKEEQSGCKEVEKGANYYTDASVFSAHLDIPIIVYGPGDAKIAHQPNEYVEVERFIEAIHYYITVAQAYAN